MDRRAVFACTAAVVFGLSACGGTDSSSDGGAQPQGQSDTKAAQNGSSQPLQQQDIAACTLLPEKIVANVAGQGSIKANEAKTSCTYTAGGTTVIGLTVTVGPPDQMTAAVRQKGQPLDVSGGAVATSMKQSGMGLINITQRGALVSISDQADGIEKTDYSKIAQAVADNLRTL